MVAKPTRSPAEQARVLRSLADKLEREGTSLPAKLLEELAMLQDDPSALAESGLAEYAALLPKDDPADMLDLNGGTPLRWEEAGWRKE